MNTALKKILNSHYRSLKMRIEIAKEEGLTEGGYIYLQNETLDEYDMLYLKEINQEKYGFKMGG